MGVRGGAEDTRFNHRNCRNLDVMGIMEATGVMGVRGIMGSRTSRWLWLTATVSSCRDISSGTLSAQPSSRCRHTLKIIMRALLPSSTAMSMRY